MTELNDRELLEELGVEVEGKKGATRTPREERIVAGFEDILKFVDEHGRPPRHGEDRDIFERLYATRLDRIRAQADCRELVGRLDTHGLLSDAAGVEETGAPFIDDAALLADLGVAPAPQDDITKLTHVKSREEIRATEEIATRERCEDFAAFEPLFEAVRKDLEAGVREARRFGENAAIKQGEFFVLGGQIAYVAAVPEALGAAHGHVQGRLRVIYDNGTRSDPLLRSMQRALYKDEAGRRITDPLAGPLFGGVAEDGDLESGTLYVLRSQSDHPDIAARRDLVHKIGVTGGSVQARVAGAANEATYLLSDVEIVATYRLFNINRAKLEAIIHRVFAAARLDLTIPDRFGRPVQPREWFLAPLPVIDEVVEHIRDGSIAGLEYDPASASLRRAAP